MCKPCSLTGNVLIVVFILQIVFQTVTSDMIIENPLDNVKEEMQDAPPADRHVDVEMGGGNGPIDNEINVEKKTDGCKDSADQELSTNASPVDETSTENGSELLVVHRDTSDDPHKDTGMDEESQDLHVDMDLDEECQGQVCHLPPAGCSNVASKDHERKVANCCAICLGTVETKESICWSSNPQCQHVFHSACALDWFQASGSKYLKQMRKTKASVPGDDFWKLNPVEQITSFPLSCPCCRQIFLIRPKDENETKSSNFEKFTLPQGNDNNESIPTI